MKFFESNHKNREEIFLWYVECVRTNCITELAAIFIADTI